MNTKYTPGPWQLQGNGTLLHPLTLAPISTTRFETSLGSFEVLDETNEPDGNARLIAASPNLLSALERLANAADNRENTLGDPIRLMVCKAELAAATRQARSILSHVAS